MKGSVLILIGATALAFTGCLDKAKSAGPSGTRYAKSNASAANGSLWRFHFIGMTQLNQSTNASKLKEVWSLPASQDLKKQALDKIAKTPFQLWEKSLPNGATNQPSLIRPLLDDFITSESYVDLKGASTDFDSVIALRLDADRARLWETNLWQLLSAWKFPKPQALSGGVPGWESRAKGISVQVRRRGNWLLAGWSLGKLTAISSLSGTLEESDRPIPALTSSFLELQADLPSLGRWNPILAKYKLPPVDITLSPRGEYIRTEGRILPEKRLSSKLDPWLIPTNLISMPLVSFTVARAIQPVLEGLPGIRDLELKKMPSQMCSWSISQGSFRTWWTFPMDNASNVLRQIAPQIPQFAKHYVDPPPAGLLYVTNSSELWWRGLPFIAPLAKPVRGGEVEYLQMGLAPPALVTKGAPAELLAQFSGRNDLVYYDWEITEHRLQQARRLYQVIDMLHLRGMAGTNEATFKWVDEAAPRLGNSITEITSGSSGELKVVRKSHIGFTGFELATLLRWVESPSFPLGYEPRPSVRDKKSQTVPDSKKRR